MTRRQALISAAILALLAAVAILAVDGPVAMRLEPVADANRAAVNPFMTAVEIAFAFPLSKFATGAALVLAALVMFAFRRTRAAAWLMLYVGVVHLLTRLVAGVSKNVFLRVRPDEALRDDAWRDQFFVDGGSSFPSGHAAHFWALFFALALAFPRLRIPALILAVVVSVFRVVVNDHYVSDVVASAAIAAFLSAALVPLMRRRPRTSTPA